MRLADAITAIPAQVPDELWEELRERFSDEQIVELASAIAWENYRSRYNRVFDIGPEGYSEGAFCPLPLP